MLCLLCKMIACSGITWHLPEDSHNYQQLKAKGHYGCLKLNTYRPYHLKPPLTYLLIGSYINTI